MRRILPFLIVIGVIVVLDQWSKYYISHNFYLGEELKVIDGFFSLKYVQNKGAAFGFGDNYGDWPRIILFKVLTVFACFWLFALLWSSVKTSAKLMTWAYTLVLGGAIGNIIDRIRLDYVVDFFDFYIKIGENYNGAPRYSHFATFNIADSFITIAAFFIILDYVLERKKNKLKETSQLSIES